MKNINLNNNFNNLIKGVISNTQVLYTNSDRTPIQNVSTSVLLIRTFTHSPRDFSGFRKYTTLYTYITPY